MLMQANAMFTHLQNDQGLDLGLGSFRDVGAREVRHALKVAPLRLGCSDLSHKRLLKVAEQQVLL